MTIISDQYSNDFKLVVGVENIVVKDRSYERYFKENYRLKKEGKRPFYRACPLMAPSAGLEPATL